MEIKMEGKVEKIELKKSRRMKSAGKKKLKALDTTESVTMSIGCPNGVVQVKSTQDLFQGWQPNDVCIIVLKGSQQTIAEATEPLPGEVQ